METCCGTLTLQKSPKNLWGCRGRRMNFWRPWYRRFGRPTSCWRNALCAPGERWIKDTPISSLIFVQYKGIIAIPVEAAIGLHYLNTTTVGDQVASDITWYQISQNMCIFMLSVYSNFCKYLLIPKDTLKQEIFLFIKLNAFLRLWTLLNKCVIANPINVVLLEERCCGAWNFMRSHAFSVHILWNSTNCFASFKNNYGPHPKWKILHC